MLAPEHVAPAVKQAVVVRRGFNPDELEHVGDFRHWAQTESGPVRIHLLREVFNLIVGGGGG